MAIQSRVASTTRSFVSFPVGASDRIVLATQLGIFFLSLHPTVFLSVPPDYPILPILVSSSLLKSIALPLLYHKISLPNGKTALEFLKTPALTSYKHIEHLDSLFQPGYPLEDQRSNLRASMMTAASDLDMQKQMSATKDELPLALLCEKARFVEGPASPLTFEMITA